MCEKEQIIDEGVQAFTSDISEAISLVTRNGGDFVLEEVVKNLCENVIRGDGDNVMLGNFI